MQDRDAPAPSPAEAPAGDLANIVAELREFLGPDAVLNDSGDLERVSRTTIPYREVPSIVVYPREAEQVSAVLELANRHGVPVWPVSRGNNWGYGSRSACYPGGITMVLERMDRIHHVDEELAYAVVEPGVTYDQLNRHLKEHGIALWADCAGSTVNASVVGNALDKGRGLTPYGDHFGNLCGMDVVLPDGERLLTGGGPADGFHTWNTYKWGTGPYLDGLFAQSNLGVVVKAGIWLMPAPECFDFFVFEFTAPAERFAPFIDDLRGLVFNGTLKSHPHLACKFAMLCIVDQYPTDLLEEGDRCLSDAALARWQARHGTADWTFGAGLYGSRAEVREHKRQLKRVLRRYGRVTFAGGWEILDSRDG